MSRVPRIETASSSRRANNLPRDPSDWVDKDLLSYVRYNYSPIEAVPLSEVIERDRLTPTALWYLQAEPEQLLAIAEEESLRDTLLGLALSLKPAVSPTSPRIRHVRRLSEDLERPPPPPPPPPPSPPTAEEPELEDDDDVAESVVSDWALDEDPNGDQGPAPTTDHLGNLADPAVEPELPVEGLGLHTGEPHLDDVTTPPPQPSTMETDDLIDLEDDPQPTMPQEEGPEPHATRADTGAVDDPHVKEPDPHVEEPTASQSASTDDHVLDAANEKPPPATHRHADPPPPSDEPSTSRDAGASMPADPYGGSNSFTSPIEDDDLGNPWAEHTSGADPSPPSPTPPPADPARATTPTSDYHDANSTHSDEADLQEAPATEQEQEPEPSPVRPEERDGLAASSDEEQRATEAPLPSGTPEKGETAENTSSGEDAPTREEVQLEENTAPASSEGPIKTPSPAAEPVETIDPVQPTEHTQPTEPTQPIDPAQTADPVQHTPPVTDSAQPSPPVADPVTAPPPEATQTQEEQTPEAGLERDETMHVGTGHSKDSESEEPPVQSTTSGVTASEQQEETAKPEGRDSGRLGGEEAANKGGEETVDGIGEEDKDEVAKDEEATIPATATTEPAETTVASVANADAVDNSTSPVESSGEEASGAQAKEQAPASETPPAQPEAEANPSSPAQGEDASDKPSIPSKPSAAENTASPLLVTDTTPATAEVSAPPSPTVRLASGIEAQLIDRDAESTEQTPSASPSDTPPDASSSPSESRQASPPAEAEAEAEKLAQPATRIRISSSSSPSSSVSSVNLVEKKPPAPPPINTAFGSLSEPSRPAKSAGPLTVTDNAWQYSSASRSTFSPATAKSVGWGSARSPSTKSSGWGRGIVSSVTSFFGSQSEASSREPSPERETSNPHTTASPAPRARQSPAIRPNPWGQGKNRSAAVSFPPSGQQASKLKSSAVSAGEPSVNVGPGQVLPPTDTESNIKAGVPTSSPAFDPPPPEISATEETNPRAEVTDMMSGSVLVDPETPSAGNGEPALEAEGAQAPPVQAVASSAGDSPDAGSTGEKETKDAEDDDIVKVTADDIADADEEAVSESQARDVDVDDDDDDNLPLNRHLERVRQITGDSSSSAVTSDTEAQDNDEQSGRGMGPKLQMPGLANAPDGADSPVVDSPITPLSRSARKRKNKKKNKGQGGS